MALPEMQFSNRLTNHPLLADSRIWLERIAARSNRINGMDRIWKDNFKSLLIINFISCPSTAPRWPDPPGRSPAAFAFPVPGPAFSWRNKHESAAAHQVYYHPRMLRQHMDFDQGS
jgi:hypothetical protein